LRGHIQRLHTEKAPPSNLTLAELEALRMVRDGLRVKQIAFELGVSEGAVKQRL
jgi:LuxR family transcriptional regulator